MTSTYCLVCKDLDRALSLALGNYGAARSAAFYRVCTDIAAKKEVDMERAKTDKHQLTWACAIRAAATDRAGDVCSPANPPDPKAK